MSGPPSYPAPHDPAPTFAAPFTIVRKADGKRVPLSSVQLIRWVRGCSLPRNMSLTLRNMINEAQFKSWTLNKPIAAFCGELGKRQTQRGLRGLEDAGIVETTPVPWSASKYRIDIRAIYRRFLATKAGRTQAKREEQARKAVPVDQRAAPGPHRATVIVREVLGDQVADLLGVSDRRCRRLWKNAVRRDLEHWRSDWKVLAENGLVQLHEAPKWLWRASEWMATVRRMRLHLEEQGAQLELASATEDSAAAEYPAGKLYTVCKRGRWAWEVDDIGDSLHPGRSLVGALASPTSKGPRATRRPDAALADLVRYSGEVVAHLLKGAHASRWDGRRLVVVVDSPLDVHALLTQARLEPGSVSGCGPWVVTWSH